MAAAIKAEVSIARLIRPIAVPRVCGPDRHRRPRDRPPGQASAARLLSRGLVGDLPNMLGRSILPAMFAVLLAPADGLPAAAQPLEKVSFGTNWVAEAER